MSNIDISNDRARLLFINHRVCYEAYRLGATISNWGIHAIPEVGTSSHNGMLDQVDELEFLLQLLVAASHVGHDGLKRLNKRLSKHPLLADKFDSDFKVYLLKVETLISGGQTDVQAAKSTSE